jgi:hypothetical protein
MARSRRFDRFPCDSYFDHLWSSAGRLVPSVACAVSHAINLGWSHTHSGRRVSVFT